MIPSSKPINQEKIDEEVQNIYSLFMAINELLALIRNPKSI